MRPNSRTNCDILEASDWSRWPSWQICMHVKIVNISKLFSDDYMLSFRLCNKFELKYGFFIKVWTRLVCVGGGSYPVAVAGRVSPRCGRSISCLYRLSKPLCATRYYPSRELWTLALYRGDQSENLRRAFHGASGDGRAKWDWGIGGGGGGRPDEEELCGNTAPGPLLPWPWCGKDELA